MPEPEGKAQVVGGTSHLGEVIVQRNSIKSEVRAESISFVQDQDGSAGGGEGWIMGGELCTKKCPEVWVQKSRLSQTDCILVREASDVHCQADELGTKRREKEKGWLCLYFPANPGLLISR